MPRFHRLPVTAIEQLTDDAVALTLQVPERLRDTFAYTAGQHLTLRGEDGLRRSYSICTPPSAGVLKVGIKRLPGGAFSGAVVDRLRVGDTLEALPPAGRFGPTLDPDNARHCAAVAAGSGITPVLAIAAAVLEAEPDSSFTLLYVNRTSQSVMFLDEVHDLKDRWPDRFWVIHLFSREPGPSELLGGRLDAARMRRLLDEVLPAADEWFLCGPQRLVLELRSVLIEHGTAADRVHLELFHADPAPRVVAAESQVAGACEVVLWLEGRSSTVRMERDGRSVLEAVLQVRPDAPYACQGGMCGTCRARVVDGEVVMDSSWALEPAEIARGEVLTCQARPVSARLVLDYD